MAYVRGNDYFKMFLELLDFSCNIASELSRLMRDYREDELGKRLEALHKIEHTADLHMHDVMEKLAKEFITPIEREDIILVARQIDDITDAIEDVLVKMYMFHIGKMRPEALAFADIIVRCCEGLKTVFNEFHNFKKSKVIQEAIIEVNRLEEEGDKVYISAMRTLYGENNALEIAKWSKVFNQLEECCDLCEDTADMVQEIIMKNS